MKNASPSNVQPITASGTASTAAGMAALATFLKERGLDPEIAFKYGWSASNGRIEIPYIRDGEIANRKYRGLKDKTFSQDGGTQFFWNVDILKDETLSGEPLIITEGEFDALAAIQAGFPRVMSVPNGAPAERDVAKLAYLEPVENTLKKIPEIILATDSDEPGANLLHDISIRLGKPRCKWLKYPQGCKDLNDALKLYGVKGVQETIRRAKWVEVNGVYTMDELPPVPYAKPYHIGISGFEKHMRLRMGDFSVVTGVPGSGKTTFINDVMSRMVSYHGCKFAVASFEQNPQADHKRNLRTWFAGKFEKNMSDEEKAKADEWINKNFVFIVPAEDDEVNLEWVLERAAVSVLRFGANVVVIDPWNEMDHIRPNGMSLTEYVGTAIRQFRKFAKKYAVHVMVIAHPAKLSRNKDGSYPIPTLYDISDSAHWYNKADLGIVVHRDEEGDFIHIVKSRYHTEIGEPGVIDVKFSREDGRYTVVDNQVMNGDYSR
jgi:twinkle protein